MRLWSILFTQKKTSILNWSDTYQTHPNTSSILLHVQSTQNKWIANYLATIHTGYRTALKERIIQIIKGKLVFLKHILDYAQQLSLIIVP